MRNLVSVVIGFVFMVLNSSFALTTHYVTTVNELENALYDAQSNGDDDEIIVAPGYYELRWNYLSYIPDRWENNYSLIIRAEDPADPPVLSPSYYADDIPILVIDLLENSPRDSDTTIRIENIIFKNGNNESYGVNYGPFSGDYIGGAVFIGVDNAKVVIEGCRFENNYADDFGGGLGIYADGDAEIQISNTEFINNEARYDGGGAYIYADYYGNVYITGSLFKDNYADAGSSVYVETDGNISVSLSVFENNRSYQEGGAYFDSRHGNVSIESSQFIGNRAWYGGGARVEGVQVFISNSLFMDNTATHIFSGHGGGLSLYASTEAVISNSVFWGNEATNSYGGGIQATTSYNGSLYFINNTIAFNFANRSGGGVSTFAGALNVYNNIFWQNTSGDVGNDLFLNTTHTNMINLFNNNFSGKANFSKPQSEDLYFSNLTGFTYSHDGNIQLDPHFVDVNNGNFHISSTSPMINAGTNAAPYLPATDIDGEDRVQYGIVDIGVDESPNPPPQSADGGGYVPPHLDVDFDISAGLDFGPLSPSNVANRTIRFYNKGPGTLLIREIALRQPSNPTGTASLKQQSNPTVNGFTIESDNCTWKDVLPNEFCEVTISFSAQQEGTYNAELVVRNNDINNDPFIIPLSAIVGSSGSGGGCSLSTSSYLPIHMLLLIVFVLHAVVRKVD